MNGTPDWLPGEAEDPIDASTLKTVIDLEDPPAEDLHAPASLLEDDELGRELRGELALELQEHRLLVLDRHLEVLMDGLAADAELVADLGQGPTEGAQLMRGPMGGYFP
jgi:hypothetical protein